MATLLVTMDTMSVTLATKDVSFLSFYQVTLGGCQRRCTDRKIISCILWMQSE